MPLVSILSPRPSLSSPKVVSLVSSLLHRIPSKKPSPPKVLVTRFPHHPCVFAATDLTPRFVWPCSSRCSLPLHPSILESPPPFSSSTWAAASIPNLVIGEFPCRPMHVISCSSSSCFDPLHHRCFSIVVPSRHHRPSSSSSVAIMPPLMSFSSLHKLSVEFPSPSSTLCSPPLPLGAAA